MKVYLSTLCPIRPARLAAALCCAAASLGADLPCAVAAAAPSFTTATPTPPAFPGYPVAYTVALSKANNVVLVGPGTSPFGVTSITLTNTDANTQLAVVQPAAAASGTTCTGSVGAASTLYQNIYVPSGQTVHITFPTPFVVPKTNSVHCLALFLSSTLTTGYMYFFVNGYRE
jgi:hypothetical protein